MPNKRSSKQPAKSAKAAAKPASKTRKPASKTRKAAVASKPISPPPAKVEIPELVDQPRFTGLAASLATPSDFELSELPTEPLPGGPKNKKHAVKQLEKMGPALATMQEQLFAEATAGSKRRVLLLLQGMDTAGKDGVIKHVVGLLNPGAVQLASFKAPTAEELEHDFLWRIRRQVPAAGQIGVFNRSQYEDVLIVRVHDLVPKTVWSKRYAQINAFERELARQGTVLIKCFLHISKKVQAERLLARLDDPTKYWKFNPADVDERGYWDEYQQAYSDVLRRTSTVGSPWYVIPSDKKWYRNWAVAALLSEKLSQLDLSYPPADFDIAEQKQRILDSE